MTPLHWLCNHGDPALVALALEGLAAAKPGGPAPEGCSSVLFVSNAAERLPIDMAGEQYTKKWLQLDDDDHTPEHESTGGTVAEYMETMRILADHMVGNAKNDSGRPPELWNHWLFWCAALGHLDGIQTALQHRADTVWMNPWMQFRTAIHIACLHQQSAEVVEAVLRPVHPGQLGPGPLKRKAPKTIQRFHAQAPPPAEKDADQPAALDLAYLVDGSLNNPLHAFVQGSIQHNVYSLACDHLATLEVLFQATRCREALEAGRNRRSLRAADYLPDVGGPQVVVQALKTNSEYYQRQKRIETHFSYEWVLVFPMRNEVEGLVQMQKLENWFRKIGLTVDEGPSSLMPKKERILGVTATDEIVRLAAEQQAFSYPYYLPYP